MKLYEVIESVSFRKAFSMGAEAYKKGQGLESCPFRPFSEAEDYWIEGWRSEYKKEEKFEDEYLTADEFYLKYGWIKYYSSNDQGRKVKLRKPMRGDRKKYKVYVDSGRRTEKGEIIAKKVEFGDVKGGLRLRKADPKARKQFVARHKCKEKINKGDRTSPGYWSCRGVTSKVGGLW